MHALKVVREAGVRRVIAKGGLEPVSRRPPLRDEPANRYPVTRDDYGLAVLDCIEDVGEVSCRLRGSYCDHDYILSDLVCLCVYKLRGLLRACSALVRWPYPWRSPSGTRIPATGAAKPGPRARGDRVRMASVAGARGSAMSIRQLALTVARYGSQSQRRAGQGSVSADAGKRIPYEQVHDPRPAERRLQPHDPRLVSDNLADNGRIGAERMPAHRPYRGLSAFTRDHG